MMHAPTRRTTRLRQAAFSRALLLRLVAFVVLLTLLTVWRPVMAEEVPVVPLSAVSEGVSLVGRIGVLVDTQGDLTIDEVRQAEMQSRFEVPHKVIDVGYDQRARWFKVRLWQAAPAGEWLLALQAMRARDVRFYGPFDEAGVEHAQPIVTGGAHPYSTRPMTYEHYAFRVRLPGPGVYTVYLRAQSAVAQSYPMALWDFGAFAEAQQNKRLLDGACYGLVMGMMIYALLMFATFRDRIYSYFLAAAGWTLVTLALLNGHLTRYLFPDAALLAEPISVLVPAVWVLFAMQFGRRFLNMRRHARALSRLVLLLGLLSLGAGLAAFSGEFRTSLLVVLVLACVGLLLMPVASRPTPHHGYAITGWYLVTPIMILLTVLAMLLIDWRQLPSSLTLDRALQLAIVAQTVVFAVALGQRLPRLQVQQGRLHDHAQQLARAAQTDPLTRIANRAGLANRALELLRPGTRRSLLILDLDHFKPINDEFGHDVGDEVLTRIARRLVRITGARDTVSRLGGDEFAILLADIHTREELEEFARRLIDAVSAPIEVRRQDHRVGASVGIAIYPENGDNLSRLMRRADLALYRVKRTGRNGFAFFNDLPQDISSFSALADQ